MSRHRRRNPKKALPADDVVLGLARHAMLQSNLKSPTSHTSTWALDQSAFRRTTAHHPNDTTVTTRSGSQRADAPAARMMTGAEQLCLLKST